MITRWATVILLSVKLLLTVGTERKPNTLQSSLSGATYIDHSTDITGPPFSLEPADFSPNLTSSIEEESFLTNGTTYGNLQPNSTLRDQRQKRSLGGILWYDDYHYDYYEMDYQLDLDLRVTAVYEDGFRVEWENTFVLMDLSVSLETWNGHSWINTDDNSEVAAFRQSLEKRGLLSSTRYRLTFHADLSTYTIEVTTTVGKPSNLKAIAISSSALYLSWKATGESTFVEMDYWNDGEFQSFRNFTNVTRTSCTIEGLFFNAEYRLRAKTFHGGSFSSFSKYLKVKTLDRASIPVPYRVIAHRENETCIELSWKCKNDLGVEVRFWVAAFEPKTDISRTPITATDSTNGTLEGLSPGTKYNIRVTAWSTSYNGMKRFSAWSNPISVTTQKKLPTPHDLRLLQYNQTAIEISWKYGDNMPGATTFHIEIYKVGEPLNNEDYFMKNSTAIIYLSTTQKVLLVKNLTSHTEYDIRIYATKGVKDKTYYSSYSHHLRVLTPKGKELPLFLTVGVTFAILLVLIHVELIACFFWWRRKTTLRRTHSTEMLVRENGLSHPIQQL